MGHRRKQAAGKAQVIALRRGEAINGILFNVREDLRLTALRSGLALMQTMFEEEVAALCGPRYEHQDGDAAYRWGRQAGVVVYGGHRLASGLTPLRALVLSRSARELANALPFGDFGQRPVTPL